MTDEEDYTNADLDMADEMLVSAGFPAIAKALRFQTQGNRNLIQGTWGMQVVEAFQNILQVQVVAALATVQVTLDKQHDLVQQILTSQKNSEKIARQALSVAKAGQRGLKKLEQDVRALNARHGEQIAALAADIAEIKKVIAARPAQRAADQERLEERLAAMERRLASLEARGG